jgi:methyl-accepting chemotaxis protein
MDSIVNLNNDSDNAVDFIDRALAAQAREAAADRGYLAVQSPTFLQDFATAKAEFVEAMAGARKNIEDAKELTPLIDDMQTTHDAWRTGTAERVVSLASNPLTHTQGMTLLALPSTRAQIVAYTTAAAAANKATNIWSDDCTAKAKNAIAQLKLVLIVGGALAAALSALVGWLVAGAIAKPVAAMTRSMKTLAAGDNTVEIPAMGQKDEVGEMAGAVQMFKTAAIEKIRLTDEAATVRRAAEAEREDHERTRAETARQQAMVVDSIAAGLDELSQGNLVYRLTDAFAPEYEKLRTDFNGAMTTLQDTLKMVAGNTATIRSGAVEISSASDDLSRRTEQQAASLEETAAALDEITATVKKTADSSKYATTVVSSAKADAEQSGEVVNKAVIAMGGIEKSSQEISQIIGVIDEIAFQTNLLALNAGVEAARAGDAGRGFAVVASEVRALAQRSATAAKEIKTLISTSGQQVKAGVDLVGETGKALGRIVIQVNEINGIVADIAASAQEQATALHQVNSAVNQMDQVTQQNAAMVEEATAASQSLSQETDELARLVGKFQVGEADIGRGSARKPARPQALVRAMKTTGAGGAVRKPSPGPSAGAESWEEF